MIFNICKPKHENGLNTLFSGVQIISVHLLNHLYTFDNYK